MAFGGSIGRAIKKAAKEVGKNIDHIDDAVLEDLAQLADHPGYLAAGPLAPVLADLNRRGALRPFTKGAQKLIGAATGMRPARRSGGDHPKPRNIPVNTKRATGYCDQLGGLKPFCLVGRIAIAAGATTQGTDLGDFHDATSNPTIITTNNLIPGNVQVESCALSLGVVFVTTLGAETLAVLEDFVVIERVNGTEVARWTLRDLGLTVDHSGSLGTTFSASSQFRVTGDWKDWPRTYDPNVTHEMAVQIMRTFTLVNALEMTFLEPGMRP